MAKKDSAAQQSPLQTRRRVATLVAVVAVLSSAAGLGLSFLIRSPQQLAAEAEGPGPTTLTSVVERRLLKDTVIIRGSVVGSRTVELQLTASEGRNPVVTALRAKTGSLIDAGDVIMEVSGRPVFGLRGNKPAYRDLLPGSSGDDVAQLQAALESLGFAIDDPKGSFGPGTKRALIRYYDRIGYEYPTTRDTDEAAMDAAENAVVQADRTREDAAAAARTAKGAAVAPARTALERATEDARRARSQLADLDSRSGVMLPSAEAVFLPAFPARVEKLDADVGEVIKESPLTISSGKLVVTASVNAVQRQLLEVGMPVQINTELSDKAIPGKITAIGALTSNGEGGGFSHPVTVQPTTVLSAKLSGQDVRLTVERESTGTEVLVLPQSAVFASADGSSSVLRQTSGGAQEKLTVRLGASGDGYVAIISSEGDRLKEGDRVLIGDGGPGVTR